MGKDFTICLSLSNEIEKCNGVKSSDRPKQVFMAETEPKPNFGFHSSFGRNRSRNRNSKEVEINDFVHT